MVGAFFYEATPIVGEDPLMTAVAAIASAALPGAGAHPHKWEAPPPAFGGRVAARGPVKTG